MRRLHDNGYTLGILSNTVEDRLKFIDKQIGLSNLFTASVLSYKDRVIKPDKKAPQLISDLRSLGITV